jgi:spore germination protein
MEIYVVQPGDSLFTIARKYNITVDAIQNLNRLPNPDQLVVGQTLLIPGPPAEALRYTIVSGDTLYLMAQSFNTTVMAIAQANNIPDPGRIQAGTVLVIPGWSQVRYTVRPGDTLYIIAGRYNIALDLIVRTNRIADPSRIYPGQTLIIPRPVPPVSPMEIETLAYFHLLNMTALERALPEVGPYITFGALFNSNVSADGNITVPANTTRAVNLLNDFDIRPLMVITNWGTTGTFDPDVARAIIGTAEVKARTIANVLALMSQYGFAGVNVDFENMYPEDRQLYTAFIRDLASALNPRGYLVTLAMAPKYADFPNSAWVGTFDYAALGRVADFIHLMTYEWGWVGGPPMAVAPINQVRPVLEYATSLIPPEKILQGIPLYGYNWPLPHTPDRLATPVNLVDVYSLAYRYNANISYDPVAQSPWFRYTDENGAQHEVWFEDLRSLNAKYGLIKEFNLRGAGFWANVNYPYGTPAGWALLGENFTVVKY